MKEEQFQSLLNCFLDTVNRFNEASKGKRVFGGMQLYQAEIHTIEAIGLNKGINVTNLAGYMGVTKGAVSQMIGKLEKKKLIHRNFSDGNNQEVLLGLTENGQVAFNEHSRFHNQHYKEIKKGLGNLSDSELELLFNTFRVIGDTLKNLK